MDCWRRHCHRSNHVPYRGWRAVGHLHVHRAGARPSLRAAGHLPAAEPVLAGYPVLLLSYWRGVIMAFQGTGTGSVTYQILNELPVNGKNCTVQALEDDTAQTLSLNISFNDETHELV